MFQGGIRLQQPLDPSPRLRHQAEFVIQVLYWGLVIVLSLLALTFLKPILTPFFIAFLLAWAIHKPIDWLAAHTPLRRSWIAIVLSLATFAVVGLAVWIGSVKLAYGIQQLVGAFPAFFSQTILPFLAEVFSWVEDLVRTLDPTALALLEDSAASILSASADMATSLSSHAVSALSGAAATVPGLFLKTIILVIVTVFLSIDYHAVVAFLLRQLPERGRMLLLEGRTYLGGTLFACLRSYILIMGLTFVELSVGLSILRIPNAIAIAAIIAVVDILPVLGTGGILIPWAIIAAVTGDLSQGIGIALLYLAITVIRNIVEPKLVGQQIGLHPVVTLGCMLLGLHFFGLVGMFGFPILLSLLLDFDRRGLIHLLKK